jgi:ABC-type transport system involved in cytochrome bd biosynthesis fused ATPase/permease subunit
LAYATNKKLSDEDLFSVLKKVDLYSLISKSDQKLETEI